MTGTLGSPLMPQQPTNPPEETPEQEINCDSICTLSRRVHFLQIEINAAVHQVLDLCEDCHFDQAKDLADKLFQLIDEIDVKCEEYGRLRRSRKESNEHRA